MKILFDENVPKKLKRDLHDFSIFTVQELGWEGKDNGVLLEVMLSHDFDVLITGDKNMENQQNFEKYPLPVLLLRTRFQLYSDWQSVVPELISLLRGSLRSGVTYIPQ